MTNCDLLLPPQVHLTVFHLVYLSLNCDFQAWPVVVEEAQDGPQVGHDGAQVEDGAKVEDGAQVQNGAQIQDGAVIAGATGGLIVQKWMQQVGAKTPKKCLHVKRLLLSQT